MPLPMNERIKNVLEKRLLAKDINGEIIEDVDGMLSRVATYLGNSDEEQVKFYDLMDNNLFLPNSPCLVNAGLDGRLNQLSACFVLEVPDSIEGIYDTLKETALIHKCGGGTGFDFTNLRPANSAVKSTGGIASGPVSFMKVFDASTEGIKQGGVRRGANMGVLRIDHPDIEEFITCKRDGITAQNFNISIAVTNAFMQALIERRDYELINPFTGEPCKEENAKKIFDLIVDNAWATGDPGVLFIDRMNEHNPLSDKSSRIAATNPCWTGDTKVWTINGLKRFDELAATGKDVKVLTNENNKLVFKWMRNPRKTADNANLVRIMFDNGTNLTCTPNHNIILKDGTKVQAKDLQFGDSVESCYRYNANKAGYKRLTNGTDTPLEHHVVMSASLGRRPRYPEEHCHHIDGVKDNNTPDNLTVMCAYEHNRNNMLGVNNPMYGIWDERNPLYSIDTAGKNNGRYREDISDDELRELRNSGMSYGDIALQVGCSKYTVQKRLGWKRNHKVVAVEHLDEIGTVYNGTVDDTHTYFVFCGEHDAILSANCGEQPLAPNEACGLGSLNLSTMVSSNNVFDYDLLRQSAMTATLFLHRMIHKSEYPNEKIAARVQKSAKIGLGHMGFADALIKMKMQYTSEEAITFAAAVGQAIIDAAVAATHDIGKREGTFPLFSNYKVPKHIKHALHREGIPANSYTPANSCLTTIAPTGTISIIADASSGIEPLFYLEQIENRADTTLIHRHSLYEAWKINNPDAQKPSYFQDLNDIDYTTHINIQATFQRYVCSGVSKTVNLPQDATQEDIGQIIREAYYTGCKGTTIYRDGSKQNQVISNGVGGLTEQGHRTKIKPLERPEILDGKTYQIRTGYGDMLVTINSYLHEPFEVICQLGKSGASEMAKAEVIGKLVSMLLRCNVDIDIIIKQLDGIVGGSPTIGKHGTIYSIPDALAKVMKVHTDSLGDIEIPAMMKCPEQDCKSSNLQAEGSCICCKDCGWKSCS